MSVTSGIMLSDNMGASKDAMDEEGNAAADLGLVARIRESFDSLTATEREAAQFILGHLTDVLVCNSVESSHWVCRESSGEPGRWTRRTSRLNSPAFA